MRDSRLTRRSIDGVSARCTRLQVPARPTSPHPARSAALHRPAYHHEEPSLTPTDGGQAAATSSVRSLELAEIKKLSRIAAKAQLLHASLEREQARQRKKPLKAKIRKMAPMATAVVVLAAASYVVIDSWLINSEARKQLSHDQTAVAVANNTDATPEERQAAEGKDESDRSRALDNYRVEASLPRAIFIDQLNVKARILPMSVNPDGSMQAPINIFDAGWYTGSVRPGQLGASVIVGHASGPTREGLFAYLDTLSAGDTITIERGDGTKLNYQVTEKKNVPLDQVNMNEMLSTRGTEEGLNIMTCGGKWLPDKKTFGERVMLFTKRIS